MKKIYQILFILSVLLLNFFCKKEVVNNTINEPAVLLKENAHVNVDVVKKLIPEAYKQQKRVVFINKGGETRTFKIYYQDEVLKEELNGIHYTSDAFRIELQSEFDPEILIALNSSAGFKSKTEIGKGLSINFQPSSSTKAWTLNTFSFLANDEIKDKILLSGYVASKDYNGKFFKDVFVSPKWDNEPISSEIAYNAEFGVVAYRELNNEVFVFDRFE